MDFTTLITRNRLERIARAESAMEAWVQGEMRSYKTFPSSNFGLQVSKYNANWHRRSVFITKGALCRSVYLGTIREAHHLRKAIEEGSELIPLFASKASYTAKKQSSASYADQANHC